MDGRSYGFAYLGTPMTNISGHSVDIAPNPSLDLGTFRHVLQGPSPVIDEVRTNFWSPDIPAHTVNAQVDAKARLLVG
jgi:hypothetical protein